MMRAVYIRGMRLRGTMFNEIVAIRFNQSITPLEMPDRSPEAIARIFVRFAP